jgi:predicted DNA binding protein
MMAKEMWKTIKHYSNYQVSNLGRIKRNYKSSELILKPQLSNSGYLRVQLSTHRKYKKYQIHRLVLLAFLPSKIKLEVNHIDGNKTNNILANLEWVTPSQNSNHAYANNLRAAPKGEINGQSKLTEKEVRLIRFAFKSGFWNMRHLAEEFKINKTTIFEIIHNKTWKHIC